MAGKTILVFGDGAIDWFLQRHATETRPTDYRLDARLAGILGWRIHEVDGGVLLLANLLEQACKETILSPKTDLATAAFKPIAARLVHGLARIETVNPAAPEGEHRFRIAEPMYYAKAGPGEPDGNG